MMLPRFRAYVRDLSMRHRREAEADEELAFHVEQETAATVARGLSPAESRRLALAHLGGVTQTHEAIRDVLAATGVLAAVVPARRAAGVDPLIVLRQE